MIAIVAIVFVRHKVPPSPVERTWPTPGLRGGHVPSHSFHGPGNPVKLLTTQEVGSGNV